MVWRDGETPAGSQDFAPNLTEDLIEYGFGVLALALELRDANSDRDENSQFYVADAFESAAEAIESAVRRGTETDPERGRNLVISAAAYHLGGYSARAYSLLPTTTLNNNLDSTERALALLLRRDFYNLRALIISWLSDPRNSDEHLARRLADTSDSFDADDAVFAALTRAYFCALGNCDTTLLTGHTETFKEALRALNELIEECESAGNLTIWWVATLTLQIFRDLWTNSLHTKLPTNPPGADPIKWSQLRRHFIAQMCARHPPHIDLWPSQVEAAGRATDANDDLVIALPTSAGKTRIAELCILRALSDGKRTIYVTPLRALSAQVERILAQTFVPLGANVSSLYGATGVSATDNNTLVSADIVVATPEKLDFALRQDPNCLADVGLIVLDEGHMIGLGSREIRYEVLIQRLLQRHDAMQRRIVCLSAMFNPGDSHFQDFTNWLRSDAPGESIHVKWRPTRQRLAHVEWSSNAKAGRLSFIEGEKPFVPRFVEEAAAIKPRKKPFPSDEQELCVATADAFMKDGHHILIYSPQRSQIDPLIRQFNDLHRRGYVRNLQAPNAAKLKLARAVGREWLGADHNAVLALEIGIGTHHGALPRPFQSAVEELLHAKQLRVVVASPTLAQGLDLSCGVLIFRGLTRYSAETHKQKPISAAEFANVIGRAGRAYVDLDGIIALPTFESGYSRTNKEQQFRELIEGSRTQRLISGLASLILEIAKLIASNLKINPNEFTEYLLNNTEIWSDPSAFEVELPDDEDDGAKLRSGDEYLADLDLALLSLIEELDLPTDELAKALDHTLQDSLWKRTLGHLATAQTQEIERELLVSRAEWLWKHTTAVQRHACFSSSLGAMPGTFLYDNIDLLVGILSEFQSAVIDRQPRRVAELACDFADVIFSNSFFAPRSLPSDWRELLVKWVTGVAFSEILAGFGTRAEQKAQTFIQDAIVFKLVWAAEAVRVQALSTAHSRADELGDGPMLSLTHGVPSVPAALLCQFGYASRVGAVWLTKELISDFTTFKELRNWITDNRETLQDGSFWPSADHRLLWEAAQIPANAPTAREWVENTLVADVVWEQIELPIGSAIRAIRRDGDMHQICSGDLVVWGTASIPLGTDGVIIDARVVSRTQIQVTHFGPG